MTSLRRSLRGFFFPPPGSSRWVRILPYAVLGALTLLVLIASAYAWDYTNSPGFCGTTCHTMPPEYTAYLTSPHARIDCVDCHIGKGFIATRITRKAGDLKHIFATAFHTYEYPIRAGELRPARETCEKCHSPAKFSDDSLRAIVHYADDKDNTNTTTYLILKTGGGTKRLGLGKGIHWHIENPVYYLATDPEEQSIPFVRVVNDDGTQTDYTALGSTVDPASIQPDQLKEMDCITCHNRITHLIYQPEDSLDQLLKQGVISSTIPEIHKKGVEAMRASYATVDEAMAGIAALADYYQGTYPDFMAQNRDLVDNAIRVIQETFRNIALTYADYDEERVMLGGAPAGATARARTFLVVEDHDISREIMQNQLTAVGCAVRVAANGREAYEAYRRCPCDVVLTDIEMPEMDGYALAAAIRALGDTGRRPVILAITASDFDMNEREASERGFDGYMLKPLELPVLEAKLVALARQAASSSPPDATMPGESP